MPETRYEYLLTVYRKEPLDKTNLSQDFWRAHIKNAHCIPRIGETIESGCGQDSYSKYKVFEVKHNISPVLSELITEGRSELKESQVKEGLAGLIRVLAFKIE